MSSVLQILLVTESQSNFLWVTPVLETGGYSPQITCVQTEAELMTFLSSQHIDLIFIDAQGCPGFSGDQILQNLRSKAVRTPGILLLEAPDEGAIVRALRNGAFDIITATNPQRLIEVVQAAQDYAHHTSPMQGQCTEQSENILRALMEESKDVIWVKDCSGRYMLINLAGAEFLGKEAHEILGKDDSELFAAETAEKIQASDNNVMSSGITQYVEDILTTSQGVRRDFIAMKGTYRNKKGQVEGVFGIVRDITELRQAEEAVALSEEKYRSLYTWEKQTREKVEILRQYLTSHEIYTTLVREVGNTLAVDNCFVINFNDSIVEPVQYESHLSSDIVSAVWSGGTFFPIETLSRGVNASYDEYEPFMIIEDVEADTTLDQELKNWLMARRVRSLVRVSIDYEAQPLCLFFIESHQTRIWSEHEVFFLKTLASQIAITLYQCKILQELRKTMQSKSQFLSNMSHELRTPLNAVIGYSEMLENGMAGALTEKQGRYIQYVAKSGRHLLNLVNDILDLSKIESGQDVLYIEKFDVLLLLKETCNILYNMAMQKDITFLFEHDLVHPHAYADAMRIKQILYNLLSNAIKFTEPGGKVLLKAATLVDAKTLVITVKDTGIGIPHTDRHKVFSEFVQLDNSYARRQEGTGLGLALTRKFVELHDGTIEFESQPGIGTTFIVKIPCMLSLNESYLGELTQI